MKSTNFQSYAIALFDIVKTKQEQEKYYLQVLELNGIINTYPELAKLLSTITLNKQDRKQTISDLLKELKFDQTFIYWVWTIIDNNDFNSYSQIAKECKKLHHSLFNVTSVDITTASELNESQYNNIVSFFEKKLNTKIDLEIKVDPKLIGGLQIQVNNKTYNNTIRNKLNNLKQQLLSKKG